MKRFALLIIPLALGQCVSPPKPGVDPAQTEKRWEDREQERTAFADGLADGEADFASGSPRSHANHQGRFVPGTPE